MNKQCRKCKLIKSKIDFCKDKTRKDGLNCICKECMNNISKNWRLKNPDYHKTYGKQHYSNNKNYYKEKHNAYNKTDSGKKSMRKTHLRIKFNITPEDYDKMLINQKNKCKICGSENIIARKELLAVDHDHKSGKIRGLLCNKCNRGLGCFNDNINLFKKAIKYLG